MKTTLDLSSIKANVRDNQAAREAEADELKAMKHAELRRRIRELEQDNDSLKQELRITGLLSETDLQPLVITPDTTKGDEATAVVLASDWHVYETVRKSEVNGLNEYSVSIARKSIETFFQKIAMLADIERKVVRVDKLVLGLLGDLMTGQLHQDQSENNSGTAMEEVLFLMEVIVGGIDFLLTQGFKSIQIPCCDGNHSRNTDKPQHTNRVKHSYEWLLFNLLARHYHNESRVQFDIAEGQLLYTELYGRTIRWTHGDAIKYKGGIGGLTIPAIKCLVDWDKGRKADMTFFGHLHTSLLHKSFCSNGSLLGYGPYSIRIHSGFEPPQQAFMLFDSKRGMTAYRPIVVR
jgi:hypothetical protein